jgi:hypothetical protein
MIKKNENFVSKTKKTVSALTILLCLGSHHALATSSDSENNDTTQSSISTFNGENHTNKMDASKERLQIHGFYMMTNDHTQQDGLKDWGNQIVLMASMKLNEHYTVETTSEFHHCLSSNLPFSNSADGKLHDWSYPFFDLYLKGDFKNVTFQTGQFSYIPAYGVSHGLYQSLCGGMVTFGNVVKTTIAAGTTKPYWPGTSSNSTLSYADGTMKKSLFRAIDIVIPVSKTTNIRALYDRGAVPVPIESSATNPELNFSEYGFDTTLAKNVHFEAAKLHSTASTANDGSYASVTFKEAQPQKPKSFDIFITYHNLESNSIMGNNVPLDSNQKGIRYGIHYVPTKNVITTLWYDNVKEISTNKNNNKIRAQLQVLF